MILPPNCWMKIWKPLKFANVKISVPRHVFMPIVTIRAITKSIKMENRKIFWMLLPLASLFFISACAQTLKSYESPKGYDLNNAQRTILPNVLHEVSGIAFPEENSDLIFANEDENGKVYFFP